MKENDPTPHIAARLREERAARGWSLEDCAQHSGVSRAMLSKIERGEASPTAALLGRISGALSIPIGSLLAGAAPSAQRLLRAADQPRWKDPDTRYLRRQLSPVSDLPLQLIEVTLPARQQVAFPRSAYTFVRQLIWVMDGTLAFHEGSEIHRLDAGDCLALGPPADCVFRNPASAACRYLVAITRR